MENALLAPVSGWELTIRLGVALLVGVILGLERELKGKSAGLRTYTLVSFGTAIFMMIPIQLGVLRQDGEAFSRVIQGIIAGIGFIGGGTILQRARNRTDDEAVKGLTSAAAIWVTAALGVAGACGLWQLALVGAGVSLFILRLMKKVE
ncbi:MAG: MgtC/SapB family protein [Leptolyngbya sp. Prado105]|jgi:putative Mg2+ transporter-C (MgtC) family protein|nr:MgtC/SapB family protein [Leptolyngbya sp. Prado105]